MSKTNAVALPTAFLEAATLNVNVGIDEVVSVFVTKYEDTLFTKKDELSKNIKTVKSELEALDKRLAGSVDKSKYTLAVPELGLSFKAGESTVAWEDSYRGKKNTIVINVEMFDKSDKDAHAVYRKTYTQPIPKADIAEKARLDKDLEQLEGELMEVMQNIKAVSRKERQIRGRISEMKLEKAGYSDLLGNAELLKLIQA